MLNATNTIYLKAGSAEKSLEAISVEYGVELQGELTKNIENTLSEDYSGYRLTIDIELVPGSVDSLWIFNTFYPAFNTKQFKESGGTYFDVVVASSKQNFKNWKNSNFKSNFVLKLLKKAVD